VVRVWGALAKKPAIPENLIFLYKDQFIAFELSMKTWALGFSDGSKDSLINISAGNREALNDAIYKAKKRFHMDGEVRIFSCYEAGRDGFWIDRFLKKEGIENIVVESASIEVNRRARRAKTDPLDARKLVTMLIRYRGGEKKVWSVVRVPTEEEEDRLRLHREVETLKKERTAHRNRIFGLLAGVGLKLQIDVDFSGRLKNARTFDDKPLQPDLTFQLLREFERLKFMNNQLKELRKTQCERVKEKKNAAHEKVARLIELRGVGIKSSWVLIMEFFGWRNFNNGKEIGALAGLVPTPYCSGTMNRELGISKAGNPKIRSLMVELSWLWLRYQPKSKLSLWFWERFGKGGSRSRRIGIIAVARKLLISFWQYLENGKIMEGAVLKAGVSK